MNVKFPVWIIYKKGCYSLFRLVMDFGCYYCHFLRFTRGRLEFTMRYDNFFIVEGIMVTSRWRTTIKALLHCFVFHVLIGILSRVHLLHIPSFFIGNCIHISGTMSLMLLSEQDGIQKGSQRLFRSQMNLLEVVCQWGSITEETNLKYYHMSEGVYNWTIYKLLWLTLVSVWQDSV